MPDWLSGLSVFTPAAWWALLTLAIPVLIHLFSRSRGRLVHIGHIDLVRRAQKLRVTEIKLTQWLLLLLRLGIFALAAMILAGLATTGMYSSKAPTLYVTPAWLYTSSKEDIDTLLGDAEQAPGSRVYLLQPGFPQANREQLNTGRQQNLAWTGEFADVWALLSERLSLEQHRGKVTVYATDYMLQFGTRRPELPRDIEWRVRHSQQPPPADKKAIRVLIIHDADRASDAALISGVLSILKEHRLPQLIWETMNSDQLGETTVNTDWLIHLGADRLSTAQIEKLNFPMVILADASGADASGVNSESTSQFVSLPFYPFTTFRLDRLNRIGSDGTGEHTTENEKVLLKSPDGNPLLQESQHGRTRLLKFNSRFNPKWSSLTQQVEFPELLLQLLTGSGQDALRFTDARINAANLPAKQELHASDIPLPRRSLQGLLAILLVILWVSERWLSERNSRERR